MVGIHQHCSQQYAPHAQPQLPIKAPGYEAGKKEMQEVVNDRLNQM